MLCWERGKSTTYVVEQSVLRGFCAPIVSPPVRLREECVWRSTPLHRHYFPSALLYTPFEWWQLSSRLGMRPAECHSFICSQIQHARDLLSLVKMCTATTRRHKERSRNPVYTVPEKYSASHPLSRATPSCSAYCFHKQLLYLPAFLFAPRARLGGSLLQLLAYISVVPTPKMLRGGTQVGFFSCFERDVVRWILMAASFCGSFDGTRRGTGEPRSGREFAGVA